MNPEIPEATGRPAWWQSPIEEESIQHLRAMQHQIHGCEACGELVRNRSRTVFARGHVSAPVCFVGEAPGRDEDRLGSPFVGAAGQLLDKIIAACGWTEQDVYICNVLKCRPPNNRKPMPPEVQNCRPYLSRQLSWVRPQIICCLGQTAAAALLDTTATMRELRGNWYEYDGIPVRCTYHPAYLLRSPNQKHLVWDDMQKIMTYLAERQPSPAAVQDPLN